MRGTDHYLLKLRVSMKGLLSVHAAFKNTLLHSHDITRMHMCERPQS